MTYREVLIRLSDDCQDQVVAIYRAYAEDTISEDEAVTLIANVIAGYNGRASALADVALAATIMVALEEPVATAGVLPAVTDVSRLEKAASTVLKVASESDVPEAIVGRLGRSEPLETAANAYSDAMKASPHVDGWVRNISGGACQLCTWWWRDGRIWPSDHRMPTHKGCTCTPQPVVSKG